MYVVKCNKPLHGIGLAVSKKTHRSSFSADVGTYGFPAELQHSRFFKLMVKKNIIKKTDFNCRVTLTLFNGRS